VVTLSVTAANACGEAVRYRDVLIDPVPTADLVGGGTIVRGQTNATLRVFLTGDPPWTLSWSDNVLESDVTDSPHIRVVSPNVDTNYTVTAESGSCQSATTNPVLIRVVPPPPAIVSATTQENRSVLVAWTAVPEASSYRIERATSVGTLGTHVTDVGASTTFFMDTVPDNASPVTYIYYVQTLDTHGKFSNKGAWDFATTATALYAQPQLVPGETPILASDVQELRTGIDALRVALGMPQLFVGSSPPSGLIQASDFTTLLDALDGARSAMGILPFTYVGMSPPEPGGEVLAAHIQQLRDALR
jgi:hypothetical protein